MSNKKRKRKRHVFYRIIRNYQFCLGYTENYLKKKKFNRFIAYKNVFIPSGMGNAGFNSPNNSYEIEKSSIKVLNSSVPLIQRLKHFLVFLFAITLRNLLKEIKRLLQFQQSVTSKFLFLILIDKGFINIPLRVFQNMNMVFGEEVFEYLVETFFSSG